MMKKFQVTDPVDLPDCWVFNVYSDADKYIDWRSDSRALFDAVEGKAGIWSISLGADGLFGVKLKPITTLWNDLWSEGKKRITQGFIALRRLRI